MKPNASRIAVVSVAVAATLLLALSAAPSAQRRRGGADPNAGVPIATNTIVEHPDAYYGKRVTISAGVEQILSKTAFVMTFHDEGVFPFYCTMHQPAMSGQIVVTAP